MDALADLAERLKYVLHHGVDPSNGKRWSQRRLSLAAGLSPAHVGMIIRHDVGVHVSGETLRRLADAAKCDLRWLSTGEGEPRLGEAPDPYPNRALAAQLAAEADVDPEAIAEVLAEEVPTDRADWPALWWADEFRRREAELKRRRRSHPAAPAAPAPKQAPDQRPPAGGARAQRRKTGSR